MRFHPALLLPLLLGLTLLFTVMTTGEAQKPGKVPRIGFLGAATPEDFPHLDEGFRQGLREFGESHEEQLKDLEAPAKTLSLRLQPVGIEKPEDLAVAFAAMAREKAGGLMILASSLTHRHLSRIADLAIQHRLPGVMGFSEFADAGGFMMYGPTWADMFRRAGLLVGKILKGAKPAELPVEQPTSFALFINVKTAKALGLTIPPSLLLRADHVIE